MIVNVQEFRDDDSGYVNWSTEHDRGYVINIQRTLHPGEARLHRADCRSISGTNPRLGPWTGAYIKVCADEVANLDAWALAHNLGAIRRCSICHPAGETFPPRQSTSSESAVSAPAAVAAPIVRGPSLSRPVVEAWGTGYIQFDCRPSWQKELRAELRARVQHLHAGPDQVLHATFFGPKPERADIENLTLYNIDDTGVTFDESARFGLRFELGAQQAAAEYGEEAVYGYTYEVVRRESGLRYWQESPSGDGLGLG